MSVAFTQQQQHNGGDNDVTCCSSISDYDHALRGNHLHSCDETTSTTTNQQRRSGSLCGIIGLICVLCDRRLPNFLLAEKNDDNLLLCMDCEQALPELMLLFSDE
jgi:hypothetical protein